MVTWPFSSAAISSSTGPIILHGPHHSAQKSTTTGPLAPFTSASKLASVTLTVDMVISRETRARDSRAANGKVRRRKACVKARLIPESLGGEFLAVEDRERRVQIRDEIAGILKPDRKAQQPIPDAQGGPGLRCQPLMGRRGRMGNEAFRIAKIICNGDEGKPVADGIRRLFTASNFEGNEGTAARHLPLDNLGLRMIRPARVANLEDMTVAAEKFGDPPGALCLLLNT